MSNFLRRIERVLQKKVELRDFRHLGRWGAWLVLAGVAAFSVFFFALTRNLPSPEEIANHTVAESTKIYDRTGTVLLYEVSGGKKRTVVPLSDIPQSLKDATLATEDNNFYNEPAFNWKGIVRAVLKNLLGGDLTGQGGSTITQQLARNAFLSPEKTITRKLRELILAIQLDQRYTKDKILEMYLNEIPYGPTLYGVEAASQAYFNKPVKDLTLAESATLAALPQAPSRYSPWGSHVDLLMKRQKYVLQRMKDTGRITDTEYQTALAQPVAFATQDPTGIKAPHFVLAVQDYLLQKYGEDTVRKGGLRVQTTLDWNMEQAAEKAVSEGAANNEKNFGGGNAALVAEDPTTGQILALVGSRDYFDKIHQGSYNVATQGLRQPGSALKPFVYLTGFEKGFTPETMLFDVPTEFSTNNACTALVNYDSSDTRCFHPHDYEPTQGPISVRNALAQSVNIAAVKMLYMVGIKNALNTLQSFGITSLKDPNRYGLSLVLGGGEVHLVDLVKAYSVLAQDGVLREQTMILEVKGKDGQVLEKYEESEGTRVVDAQPVRQINDILSDVDARSGLFHSSLGLTLFPNHDVAMKTGTTNDYRDAWTVGYTPNLVAGVWAGNNDNTAMHRQGSSILAAVPIWSAFMRQALQNQPLAAFTRPEPAATSKAILSGNYAPNGEIHSELYWINPDDPQGPPPANPARDSQFANWEFAVRRWAEANPFIPQPGESSSTIPAPNGTGGGTGVELPPPSQPGWPPVISP